MLQIILTIGNFLNGARGVVYGFKFDCLLRVCLPFHSYISHPHLTPFPLLSCHSPSNLIIQLRDTKTVDNKSTLLHFLADILHSKYPDAFNFYASIHGIEDARKGCSPLLSSPLPPPPSLPSLLLLPLPPLSLFINLFITVNLQNLRVDLSALRKGFGTMSTALAEIGAGDKFYSEFTVCAESERERRRREEGRGEGGRRGERRGE